MLIEGKVVDRSTIKSHLLSDTKDPFNRSPLTLEEVIPSEYLLSSGSACEISYEIASSLDTELKERIEEFLNQRRNKKTALDALEQDVVRMDTS